MFIAEYWNKEYDNNGVYFPCPIGVTWGVLSSLGSGQVAYANISLRYPGGPATPQVGLSQPNIILIDPFDYYKHTDDLFYHYKTGVPAPWSFYKTGPGVDPSLTGTPAPIYPAGWFYDSTAMQWAVANEFEFGGDIFDHLIKFDKYDIFTSTFESFLVGIPTIIQSYFQTDGPSNGLPYPPQVGDFIYAEDPNYYNISNAVPTVTTISPERCLSPEFILDTNNLISQTELDSGISTLKTLYDPHLFSGGKETEANSALAYTPEIEENIKNLCSILEIETPAKGNISASNINALLVQFLIKPRLEQLKAHFSITQEEAYESLKRESVFPGNKLLSAYDRSYLSSSSLVAGVIASGLDKEYNLPPVGTKLYGVFSQINIVEGPEAKLVSNSTITEDSPEKLAHELLDTLGTSAFDDKLALWVNKIEHHIRR
jgi:hypothetical protein